MRSRRCSQRSTQRWRCSSRANSLRCRVIGEGSGLPGPDCLRNNESSRCSNGPPLMLSAPTRYSVRLPRLTLRRGHLRSSCGTSSTTAHSQPTSSPTVPRGRFRCSIPDAPGQPHDMSEMSGYADLHAHLMAHLAFGGRLFWGRPYTSGDPLADMADELGPCTAAHGSWRKYLNPEGRHRAGGYPRFDGWPRYSTLVHQQAYIDWLKRAYDGGLRLVCCLAVHSEALAQVFGGGPTNDRAA